MPSIYSFANTRIHPYAHLYYYSVTVHFGVVGSYSPLSNYPNYYHTSPGLYGLSLTQATLQSYITKQVYVPYIFLLQSRCIYTHGHQGNQLPSQSNFAGSMLASTI